MLNVVYDTSYTQLLPQGGFPYFDEKILEPKEAIAADVTAKVAAPANGGSADASAASNGILGEKVKVKKPGFFDQFFQWIFGNPKKAKQDEATKIAEQVKVDMDHQDDPLTEQIKQLIEMPDEKYNDKLLTSELRKHIQKVEKEYVTSLADYKSHMAPSFWEIKPSGVNISGLFGKTYYAHNYPSYIDFLWTRDMMNFYDKWDMSWFIYPEEDADIQSMLKRRSTQLRAEMNESSSKGITIDTEVELQYRDVEDIRQKLATREERYFETSCYISLYDKSEEKLAEESKKLEQKIAGYGIRVKPAIQRMDEGLNATMPLALDDLGITRSMVTSSLAGSFPFISNDLIEQTGILYGANMQTGSLVIFDRFSKKLQNANSVVLATSGAGKSFSVKLEIMRYLLLGIPTIVIDPENEYKALCEKVGGTYVNIAINSQQCVNPFDLPPRVEDVEYGKGDLLRSQIMALLGLVTVLIGGVTPEEEALLDRALQSTYALKEITLDQDDYTGKQPPIMEDLLHVLEGMDGGNSISVRLSKYVTGTFGKLFNNYTNVDFNTGLTAFSIRDLDEALKTPAMYNILNFIRTKVRSKKEKRLLVVDEAWIMMQNDTSANFLYGMVKRARKYGLGITTITQDIEDFVKSKFGKPIITNSALQLLLKQSTASIKELNNVLGLSDAEKQRLVAASIGE
ncbi:DUF87 domain-containing protein [Patescibacteria group bacterium]|nr:DUF87 domain-containing protein [Patescibacteria group bacterium]